jgi:hypothetical protein
MQKSSTERATLWLAATPTTHRSHKFTEEKLPAPKNSAPAIIWPQVMLWAGAAHE